MRDFNANGLFLAPFIKDFDVFYRKWSSVREVPLFFDIFGFPITLEFQHSPNRTNYPAIANQWYCCFACFIKQNNLKIKRPLTRMKPRLFRNALVPFLLILYRHFQRSCQRISVDVGLFRHTFVSFKFATALYEDISTVEPANRRETTQGR